MTPRQLTRRTAKYIGLSTNRTVKDAVIPTPEVLQSYANRLKDFNAKLYHEFQDLLTELEIYNLLPVLSRYNRNIDSERLAWTKSQSDAFINLTTFRTTLEKIAKQIQKQTALT